MITTWRLAPLRVQSCCQTAAFQSCSQPFWLMLVLCSSALIQTIKILKFGTPLISLFEKLRKQPILKSNKIGGVAIWTARLCNIYTSSFIFKCILLIVYIFTFFFRLQSSTEHLALLLTNQPGTISVIQFFGIVRRKKMFFCWAIA